MQDIDPRLLAHVTGGRSDAPKTQAMLTELRGMTAKLTGKPPEGPPPIEMPKLPSPTPPVQPLWSGATVGAPRGG